MITRNRLLTAGIFLCVLFLLLYATFAWLANFHFTYASYLATLKDKDGNESVWDPLPVKFPHVLPLGDISARHEFDMRFTSGIIDPTHISLMADDCLDAVAINDIPIDLSGMSRSDLCNYGKYIVLPIGGKIHAGENKITLTVSDAGKVSEWEGNHIRLSIGQAPFGVRVEIPLIIGFAVCCLLVLTRSRVGQTAIDPVIGGILGLGLVFYLHYAAFYPFTRFSDINAHLEYIYWLYYEHVLPAPYSGWQTYQPPTYYFLLLPFYWLGALIGATDPIEVVRCLDIACFLTFLLYGIATLRLLVAWKPAVYIGVLLMVLWPVGMVYSTKVNNDLLLYAVAAACIYYLIRWQRQREHPDAWRACALALAGAAIKSNGILLVVIAATAIGFTAWRARLKLRSIFFSRRVVCGLMLIALLSIGINFGRNAYGALTSAEPRHFLMGNISQQQTESDWKSITGNPNMLYNLLAGFDPVALVKKPFKIPPMSNRLFWNTTHLLLLFSLDEYVHPRVTRTIVGLYLLLLAYSFLTGIAMLVGARRRIHWVNWYWLVPAVALALNLASIMYMWALRAGSFDTRYIYYCVPLLVALFARSIEFHWQAGRAIRAGIGIALTVGLAGAFLLLALLMTYFS